MDIISKNSKIICIIYRADNWIKGLNFITPENLFIQVGSWWYDKGKVLDSHIHNYLERKADRTQEMVYVVSGRMKVLLFNEDKSFISEYILNKGDLAIFAYGGHGYVILEKDTKIVEAKNGPFIDVLSDKTKF